MSDHTDTAATIDDPFDATLTELFASARPDAGLEDRLIGSIRASGAMPRRKYTWRSHPLTWGVAASIGLGAIGAGLSQMGDGLPLPWETGEAQARKFNEQRNEIAMGKFGTVANGFPAPRTEDMPADAEFMDFTQLSLGKKPETIKSAEEIRDAIRNEVRSKKFAENGVGTWGTSPQTWDRPSLSDTTATAGRYKKNLSDHQSVGREVMPGGGAAFGEVGGMSGAGPGAPSSGMMFGTQMPPGGGSPDGEDRKKALLSYYANPTYKGKESGAAQFNPELYRWTDGVGDGGKAATSPTLDDSAPATKLLGVVDRADKAKKPEDTVLRTVVVNGKTVTEAVPVTVTKTTTGLSNYVNGVTAGQPAEPAPQANVTRKVILRSGEIEFEIESFDSAVAAVTKLVVAIDGAFVSTVNSDKLPNGKVKGAVVLRVPPDKLDGLVLDLRKELGKGGELKGQRIGSQDVTKQYTDLESRLKAARTMETRLLAMIKDGKGEIKQLLDAEKELGVWRTKIEEYEGELRYFANLASLSTLTVTLAEKEIKSAAGVTESEVVQTGVEVEDVEQAFRDALAAVAAANGRVTKSDLKQVSSGQFNATLNFEIAPEAAGPVRDRLRQLGRVARLEITRVAAADAGGTVTKDAKVKKGDTQFQVQLYNVANIPPRETVTLRVATPDVPVGYGEVRKAVEKAKGRIFVASLSGGDKANPTAQLDFEVKRAEESAVMAAIGSAGETVHRDVTRVAEGDAVTDTKVLVRLQFLIPHQLAPRESIGLGVEVADVDAAGAVLTTAVKDAGGRVADSGTSTDRASGRMTARYVFDVPAASAAGIAEKAKAAGTVKVNQVSRNPSAPEGRFAMARIDVTFATPDRIVAPDDGFTPQLKNGLSKSATALFASLSWLVFGLLVVLPWALAIYGVYRLIRRLTRSSKPTTPTA